jgi:hypothetical protein
VVLAGEGVVSGPLWFVKLWLDFDDRPHLG